MKFVDRHIRLFIALSSLMSLLFLAACSQTINHTNIPAIDDNLRNCQFTKLSFTTTNDLIDSLYVLKKDALDCKNKHDTIEGLYDNLRGDNIK